MLVALVLLALVGLFCVGVVGAAFSLAALLVVQRFGRGSLVVLWLVTSAALAALGTSRLPARRTGAGHDVNVPGLFALLLAWLFVIFAVPTFVAWRRPAVPDHTSSPTRAILGGVGWTFAGTPARDLHGGHPEGRRCPVRHGALIHAHLPHRRVARPGDAQLRVDPAMLEPFVPHGTTLDRWRGGRSSASSASASRIRASSACRSRHRTFEEVNLRFYVRRDIDDEVRRGVTFIRELVPRPRSPRSRGSRTTSRTSRFRCATCSPAQAAGVTRRRVARRVGQRLGLAPSPSTRTARRRRSAGARKRSSSRSTTGATRASATAAPWSTESSTRAGECGVRRIRVFGDLAPAYGNEFARVLTQPATSAFIADGSSVSVGWPSRLGTA